MNLLLVCHKALSLARYFFYCTLLSFSTSSRRLLMTATVHQCSSSTTVAFVACVEAIDAWMRSNLFKMNAEKTQLIWLGTKQQLDKLSITELSLLSANVTSSTVYDLGFLLDSQLTMKDHVLALCQS